MNDADRCSERASTAFEVRRTIPLASATAGDMRNVLHQLGGLEGVKLTSFDEAARQLKISYDAARIGLAEIRDLLHEAGVREPSTLMWRLKAAWYGFLDSNAKTNARSSGGACCNRPPPSGK